MAAQRQQIERVLDAALYAPLGLALTLCERLPKQLRQRRQAVENRVQLARFFGEMAVRYGKAEYERQLAERHQPDDRAHEQSHEQPARAEQSAPAVPVVSLVTPRPDASPPAPAAEVPDAGSLPISDYESLAAIHVVQRLGSLRDDEIEQVRRFEAAHRARRTILAKIDQLQDAPLGQGA